MSFDDVYKSAKVLYELDLTSALSLTFPLTVENNKAFMFFSNTSDNSTTSITINQNISIKFSKNDTAPTCFGFPFELKTIDFWNTVSTGKLIIIGFN
jgi:hypothetical protein